VSEDTKLAPIDAQIVKIEKQGLEVLGSPERMKENLELNGQRLDVVHDFVRENFRKGIDFGKTDDRSDKASLMKPGAERVCKLFNATARWRMDQDTWEMLGRPSGTVCYLCELVDNTTGEVIGEGRGAEKVGNKARDANKAIKNAEKCALVDAVLYTFGLSEQFTQDQAPEKNNVEAAKRELWSMVEELRMGCNSTMTTNAFLVAVVKCHTHGSKLETIGAVNAVRAAIERGEYDLETGERIPE
jgi:hypothetical protein